MTVAKIFAEKSFYEEHSLEIVKNEVRNAWMHGVLQTGDIVLTPAGEALKVYTCEKEVSKWSIMPCQQESL